MRVALLTIGDELLIGQVLNSNVQWMSEKLTDLGASVATQITVGDSFREINLALDFINSADAIIISGGLGPTHDDITIEALSKYYSIPLEYDAEWIAKVEAYFQSRNRPMSKNNEKQGYLLKGSKRIDNLLGTAAGQHFVVQSKQKNQEIFVLPGVPYEMKGMMESYVLPFITTKTEGKKIFKKTLLMTGIGESALAIKCEPVVKKVKEQNALGKKYGMAFLPSTTVVKIRLQLESDAAQRNNDENEFNALVLELEQLCGKDFYGFDLKTLESLIIETLSAQKRTISLAESCTGGLITHRLTQIPGSSQVIKGSIIAYQRAIKEIELNLDAALIDQNGIVSETVAIKMAESIRTKWATDFGVSSTGYLGPNGGDAHATVGTVWVAVASKEGTTTKKFSFENNRERNKERAAQAALDLLRRQILGV